MIPETGQAMAEALIRICEDFAPFGEDVDSALGRSASIA